MLQACQPQAQVPAAVRPVRSLVVQPGATGLKLEYPGEVVARRESRLGFRVGGKMIERTVDIGQSVRAGQVLARLDPRDLQLAESAARAQVDAAKTDHALAVADFKRYEDLFAQNFIGRAELDRRKATLDAARAHLDQAEANLKAQANQSSYSTLNADAAGVVVGVDAEAGQVVAAGTPVIRVARDNEKEVAITVPEDGIALIRALNTARVSLWALPGRTFATRVREVSAAADPATRTYAIRLALTGDVADIRLGMSTVVGFESPLAGAGLIVPLTAVFERDGKTLVWVIEEPGLTVRAVPVRLGGPAGTDIVIAEGLVPGQRVVTAGANLLQPGQKVRIDPPQVDAPKAPTSKVVDSPKGDAANAGARS